MKILQQFQELCVFGLKHRVGHGEVDRLSLPDGGGCVVKPLLELQDGLVKLSILKIENVEIGNVSRYDSSLVKFTLFCICRDSIHVQVHGSNPGPTSPPICIWQNAL